MRGANTNINDSTADTTLDTRLLRCIQDHRPDVGQVALGHKLADLGYDSFSFIDLVVRVENEFGIEFFDEHLSHKRYETVRDLRRYVESLLVGTTE